MLYQISSYIKFLLKSSNQHGVHSPFVYDLITKCFYDKTEYHEYKIIEKIRKQLYADESYIDITDFGEGSKVFKSDTRKVSKIAKQVGISQKRQGLLFRLVRYYKSDNILELGTSLGLATITMGLANSSAQITTIEGCLNTSVKAKQLFRQHGLQKIKIVNSTFEDYFRIKSGSDADGPSTDAPYQLVYIDGNHNKEKTLEYFSLLLKSVSSESIFIFDDIYWSPKMNEAWRIIIEHPKVTYSIDTFYWGIVFFRPSHEQIEKPPQKQHFSIRL